jgi:hypothetical protein
MAIQEGGTNVYELLSVGEQLAHLEYVVTPELLQEYRDVVGYTQAFYPHIAAKEYIEVIKRKYGSISVISAKHKDQYFAPPPLGKRIQVTGWVKDKYERRGRNWLVVETFAVDEDGREIVRSEHSFLMGGVK